MTSAQQQSAQFLRLLDEALSEDVSVPGVRLYVLVDAAQDNAMWRRMSQLAVHALPLLSGSSSVLDSASPHLLDFGEANTLSTRMRDELARVRAPESATFILSQWALSALQAHLQKYTDVSLPGNYSMILALWDPAILGTLLGQESDKTLHIAGPVLKPEQIRTLLAPIQIWWYQDREANWHSVSGGKTDWITEPGAIFALDQDQEDALVEAGVPDQVLYHLEENDPALFDAEISSAQRYRFVRGVLPAARQLGLEGMRDLASFTALCVIYRRRMQSDPEIGALLDQVRSKEISLADAMKRMPD